MKRILGSDFELPGEPLSEDALRSRYLEPAFHCIRNAVEQYPGCTFLTLDLPGGLEISRHEQPEGFPPMRLVVGLVSLNRGTEEEPNWERVHLGRVDCLIEEAA